MDMKNWILEKLNPSHKPNDKEKLILQVINTMCEQADTDILMAPLSGRYYLVNKRKEYWIRIFDNGITITNHKFTFSYTGVGKFHDGVIRIVEKAIEKSRDEFETAVFQNEVELLENIVINIKNK
jgi:hypothetical protein